MYSLCSLNRPSAKRHSTRLVLPLVAAAIAALTASAAGSTLTLIPIPPAWNTNNQSGTPNYGGVLRQGEARAITPDGRYVVGVNYDYSLTNTSQQYGFFHDTYNNTNTRVTSGSHANILTGAGYRTDPDGTVQLILDGMAGGWQQNFLTTNSGFGWINKRRDITWTDSSGQGIAQTLPYANSLACWRTNGLGQPAADFYTLVMRDSWDKIWNWGQGQELYTVHGTGAWNSGQLPAIDYSYVSVQHPPYPSDPNRNILHGGMLCGISPAYGRAVGWWQNNEVGTPDFEYRFNYVSEYPGAGNESSTWKFAGLDGTEHGSCWSISHDGTVIFGHSPASVGDAWHGYKATAYQSPTRARESISPLPNLPGAGGTNKLATPYGCSADGGYAVGMNYVGTELAVLWDTRDADPNNWTVTDLTALAAAEGILSPFTKLERADSVGVNANGNPVVAGYGKYLQGGTLLNRAFVMVVAPLPPRPQITSISGMGSGTITVNYTNTVAGKVYSLQYCTEMTAAPVWQSAGSKAATGTADSQTESSVSSGRRYYRLSFTP